MKLCWHQGILVRHGGQDGTNGKAGDAASHYLKIRRSEPTLVRVLDSVKPPYVHGELEDGPSRIRDFHGIKPEKKLAGRDLNRSD